MKRLTPTSLYAELRTDGFHVLRPLQRSNCGGLTEWGHREVSTSDMGESGAQQVQVFWKGHPP